MESFSTHDCMKTYRLILTDIHQRSEYGFIVQVCVVFVIYIYYYIRFCCVCIYVRIFDASLLNPISKKNRSLKLPNARIRDVALVPISNKDIISILVGNSLSLTTTCRVKPEIYYMLSRAQVAGNYILEKREVPYGKESEFTNSTSTNRNTANLKLVNTLTCAEKNHLLFFRSIKCTILILLKGVIKKNIL